MSVQGRSTPGQPSAHRDELYERKLPKKKPDVQVMLAPSAYMETSGHRDNLHADAAHAGRPLQAPSLKHLVVTRLPYARHHVDEEPAEKNTDKVTSIPDPLQPRGSGARGERNSSSSHAIKHPLKESAGQWFVLQSGFLCNYLPPLSKFQNTFVIP